MPALLTLVVMTTAVSAQLPAPAESLQDAWTAALIASREGAAARQQTESVQRSLDAVRATRLPTMIAEATYTVLSYAPATVVDIPPVTVPGVGVLQLPFDRLSVGEDRFLTYSAIGSLPLYTGGRTEARIASAQAQVQSAIARESIAILETKLRVGEAYLGVLRATRLLALADAEVRSLRAHAEDAANLVAQGIAARNDQLAAEVTLADAHQRRLQAANGSSAARAAYNRLLGRSLDSVPVLEEPVLAFPDGDLAAATTRALATRPELGALAGEAETFTHLADQTRAGTRPQLSATGGYVYQENRYQLHPGTWTAALRARWTLFDSGAARAEAAAARSQAGAALTKRDDLRSIVALQVHQAWFDVDTAAQRIAVARSAVEQADVNVRVAVDRYNAGIGIATEVLDAEALRARSQTNLALATYDHQLAILRLRYATGDL